MNSITKKCRKCGKTKFFWDFYKDIRYSGGIKNECKQCGSEYLKKRYKENTENVKRISKNWADNNREKVNERQKRYRELHPEKRKEYYQKTKEAQKSTHKIWYQNNKDHVAITAKKYREENKEVVKINTSNWAKNNPEKRKLSIHNRNAIIRGDGGKITSEQWKNLCNQYENKCLCCGRSDIKLTIDHVVPVKLGGRNSIDNIQPLCGTCNSSKGAKYIDYRK